MTLMERVTNWSLVKKDKSLLVSAFAGVFIATSEQILT
jgi:hypothetical protein